MKFVVQICISVIQIRTSVKKVSVYIIQIKIRVEEHSNSPPVWTASKLNDRFANLLHFSGIWKTQI